MAYYSLDRIISIALIVLAIAVTSSLGRRDKSDIEKDLRDLCSQTNRTEECSYVVKSEFNTFEDTDGSKGVAGVVIDLAIAKAREIHDDLNRLYGGSKDKDLKFKYISCSKNYNDANRNLGLVKKMLDSNRNYRFIAVEINDTVQELKGCMLEFSKDPFDPAHIRDRNKEFGLYLEIATVATNRLLQEKNRN
ncbi:hypothetical protein ACP275_09G063900 [Erythranthe tilingii]